jgi:ribonuclease HI
LRDCEDALRVWHNLSLSLAPTFFSAESFADWLLAVPRSSVASLITHAWFIWCRRCAYIFCDDCFPWQVVLQQSAETLRVLRAGAVAASEPQWVRWQGPPTGFVALNVDGSSLGNPGPSGAGGVVRDESGIWCFGFIAYVGVSEILKAELLALLFGLRLCWERGVRRLVVRSDSQLALQLVKHGCGPFHASRAVVTLIKEVLDRDWVVILEHTLREGNAVADLLAKMGAHAASRLQVLDSPPPAALPLLADDHRGTLFLRS